MPLWRNELPSFCGGSSWTVLLCGPLLGDATLHVQLIVFMIDWAPCRARFSCIVVVQLDKIRSAKCKAKADCAMPLSWRCVSYSYLRPHDT